MASVLPRSWAILEQQRGYGREFRRSAAGQARRSLDAGGTTRSSPACPAPHAADCLGRQSKTPWFAAQIDLTLFEVAEQLGRSYRACATRRWRLAQGAAMNTVIAAALAYSIGTRVLRSRRPDCVTDGPTGKGVRSSMWQSGSVRGRWRPPSLASGCFSLLPTFIAGELDRLYSGDRNFWRTELALIAYSGLWTPCVMTVALWRAADFGLRWKYYDFNRQLKAGVPQSGLEPDVLRRITRLLRGIHLMDLLHCLICVAVAAALAFGSPFHHWVTATWFLVGAASAFNDGLRNQQYIRLRESARPPYRR